jgi:Subtilase family
MAAKKQHLLLVNPRENPIAWKYKPRKVTQKPEEDEDKDYTQMANRLEENKRSYILDQEIRVQSRTLTVPGYIDYIQIRFQDQFDLSKFSRSYLADFGLDAVKFLEYNRLVMFAIVDRNKFADFFTKISAFIEFGKGNLDVTVDRRILFIHDFYFHSSKKISQYEALNPVVRFSLIEGLYNFNLVNQIAESLDEYLRTQNKVYVFDRINNILEIIDANQELTEDIIDNFDIIFSVTSSLSSVIRPTLFRLPERSYGFAISNANENLPLIGIIDTGIDRLTPLQSIIVGSIDKTGTDPLIDSENHGTAVAALAALGKRPYKSNYRGEVKADAHLLSLKVMNISPAPLPDFNVIEIIQDAKRDYPAIKLFVLTISYDKYRMDNQIISDYAFKLDKLSHDLGILIFIGSSNNHAPSQTTVYDLGHFNSQTTNLCSPAESMNNITIGACADNLIDGAFYGISPLKEFPTLYSRKNCQNQAEFFSNKKINKHLKKPDILQPGGDYEVTNSFMGTGDLATLEVLSSNPSESFYKNIGTSFSAPLAANLGAQLLRLYPNLSSQSIKTLVLNASTDELITIDGSSASVLQRLAGYGIPKDEKVLYSDSNSVTFLLENEIRHKDLIAFPIALPDYLKRVAKTKGLLKVTATLCFSFSPEKDNQLAYCPVFMAFTFFRNKTLEQIKTNYKEALLRNRWSQDGYAQSKPILYSNVQKINFTISRNDIVDEDGLIKVAVHCMVSPQIKATLEDRRNRITEFHKFSIAVTIEENQTERNLTNQLYNEIIAINQIENIGTIDLEADLTIE